METWVKYALIAAVFLSIKNIISKKLSGKYEYKDYLIYAISFSFIGIFCFIPRTPVSCVTKILQDESLIRSRSESLEKAPNTTEWTAPIRAQAKPAKANSGFICI